MFYFIAALSSILALVLALLAFPSVRQAGATALATLRIPVMTLRMVRQGIFAFYSSRNELSRRNESIEVFSYIKDAAAEVGIIAISLQRSVLHQQLHTKLGGLLESNPQLNLSIFVLDPKSKLVRHVAEATNRTEDELREAIEATLLRLRGLYDGLGKSTRARLHVHTYDTFFPQSLVAVDIDRPQRLWQRGTSKFLVEHYLFGLSVEDRYSFEIRRSHSPMYEKLSIGFREFQRTHVSTRYTGRKSDSR